jgi:hypothetical protein
MPDPLGDPPPPKDSGVRPVTDSGTCSLLTSQADGGEGGTCGELPLCGYYVKQDATTGNAPTPMGGTILDGIYRLTNAHEFGSGSATTIQITLEVNMGVMHFTIQEMGQPVQNAAYTYMSVTPEGGTMATQLLLSGFCGGGGGMMSLDYTAVSTQLTISRLASTGTVVWTFDKQ